MKPEPPTARELGFYFALAQVGIEMVVPIALGVWLDDRFGWRPWCTVAGAVLGLVGGLLHLMYLLKRRERMNSSEKRQGPP